MSDANTNEPDVRINVGDFGALLTIDDALRVRAQVHMEAANKALLTPGMDPREVRDTVEMSIRGIERCVTVLKPVAAAVVEYGWLYGWLMSIERLRAELDRGSADNA